MMNKNEPETVATDAYEKWLEDITGDAPLSMSPGEFAARHAQGFGCFGLHRRYRFVNEKFNEWIQEFGAILEDRERLERCRLQYLTPEELACVRQQEQEEF
jgi:hypothetical protein